MFDKLFKEHGKCIKVFLGKETVVDPYEKNVEISYLPSIPIRGIVTDLVSSQIQYKMPGIVTDKAKEIIVDKKYESFLKMSQYMVIENESYEGWKVYGRLQYRIEGDFLRMYVYYKQI